MAEHYLMCTAGYRVNLERQGFIEHAVREFEGGWPEITLDELASALTRLTEANLMRVLTEADVEAEKTRRASSRVPELDDGIYYRPGHVDFTERGYLLYRNVAAAIYGPMEDGGLNLDSAENRFDVYTRTPDHCRRIMKEIETTPAACAGVEAARIVGRTEPARIGAWRPNRFIVLPEGYHATLTYVVDTA